MWSKNKFGAKNCPQKKLGLNFFGSYEFWVKTYFGFKKIWSLTILVKRKLGDTFSMGANKFGLQKYWVKKVGQNWVSNS